MILCIALINLRVSSKEITDELYTVLVKKFGKIHNTGKLNACRPRKNISRSMHKLETVFEKYEKKTCKEEYDNMVKMSKKIFQKGNNPKVYHLHLTIICVVQIL